MGKQSARSNKNKEKRQKLKEESARLAECQAVVDKAHELADPMAELPVFKTYSRNGLNLTISAQKVADLDQETQDWAFQLTKTNMEALYIEAYGEWKDKDKKEEMTEDAAWYLTARDAENTPVATAHFRFDVDEGIEVLYVYEIQLNPEVRKKGLGKFMMQILELIAFKTNMKKVLLTVFKANKDGCVFFKDKLNYKVDETSPEETMVEALYDEEGYTYEILSKPIGQKKVKPQAAQNGHAAAKAVPV